MELFHIGDVGAHMLLQGPKNLLHYGVVLVNGGWAFISHLGFFIISFIFIYEWAVSRLVHGNNWENKGGIALAISLFSCFLFDNN